MRETRKLAAILVATLSVTADSPARTNPGAPQGTPQRIDPTIALHHGRITDVSVVLHPVWMDSKSGLPDLDSTVVARIFPRRRHSVGVIDLCAAKTRPKWELSLKPQEKAMSVTVR